MKQKIVVVDDDVELCDLIKKFLEMECYAVTLRHDGESGLKECLKNDYVLIVLDVMLPLKNGFEILSKLRKESDVPVLMLTAKDSELDKVSGLRMGADDYLTKPFSMNEFVARVQSLIRRYTAFGNQIQETETLEFEEMSISKTTREVFINDSSIELTAKEFELLYFLAKHPGQVFTKKQIYNQVWQEEYAFDDNNIMVHIRRLRKKIEPDLEHPSYIQTVWGVGYKFGKGK
ncbi:response regulator transcription factor [Candidatus Galacturonibacter soehngenii]|uniref:Stage 0 sporulation protein A homolog n=1 Tax=Candidatus Galacturonatibacter soehngenii TaxID=2307010 RepID=A0A7V7UC17_9FIRM|nr:response regulator transcription factor [Candidatus Galacturonibacter soehngenii]KAB1438360.1 response regulator transcription factor [Candidatus Galacturonibacter soehngenii]